MTVKGSASHGGFSWSTVKEIDKKRFVREKPTTACLRKIRYISIDEVAKKRRLQHLIICIDLDTGDVVHMGEGKLENALLPFLRRLKANLMAIAASMRPNAIKRSFPTTQVNFDRFHIIAVCSLMLDKLRAKNYKKAASVQKKFFKGLRFPLLTSKEKLTVEGQVKLARPLELNESLSKAYILKEDFRILWDSRAEQAARPHYLGWISIAKSSGIHLLKRFIPSLELCIKRLLAYFIYPAFNACVEGINNKIKVLKRKAYGYRDDEHYALKIYSAKKLRYSLSV